ncbi:hypothetical protein O0L34_g11641 [Tuta absoluta]|nr:hypothetical protein O0L34_g11641 [Tuta absoluta]
MLLLRFCLLLVFQCVFCELFIPVPENDANTVNILNTNGVLTTIAKGVWNAISEGFSNPDKKKIVQNTFSTKKKPKAYSIKNINVRAPGKKKAMRAAQVNILDFTNCLRNGQGDYSAKIMKCFGQNIDLPKVQLSAIEALQRNITQHGGAETDHIKEHEGVYKCFAKTPIKANDKVESTKQLALCMIKSNVEKQMTKKLLPQIGESIKKNLPFPMTAIKSKSHILDTYKRCLSSSSQLTYEGKVLYCMKSNSNFFDNNLFKYIRVGSYKVDYLKDYNDKWGIKLKFNSSILMDSKEVKKTNRK